MKKFVLIALLGLASVEAVQINSALSHRRIPRDRRLLETRDDELEEDADDNVSPNDDKDDDVMNVQLGDEEINGESFYAAGDQGMTPNGVEYVRVFPEQFNEDSNEHFMKKVIDQYALEKKNDKGQPSGKFFLGKKETMKLAQDVLGKAKKLQGKDMDAYMKQYFNRTFEHFDVNQTGLLDALDMSAFCKYIASDQSLDLDELMK